MIDQLFTLPLSNSLAALLETFYSRVAPTPFESTPRLIHFNAQGAALLRLEPENAKPPQSAELLSGRQPLPGAEPPAMLYPGHQFGRYVPQLGDGSAILIGEGHHPEQGRWEIQLKGSGLIPTPATATVARCCAPP